MKGLNFWPAIAVLVVGSLLVGGCAMQKQELPVANGQEGSQEVAIASVGYSKLNNFGFYSSSMPITVYGAEEAAQHSLVSVSVPSPEVIRHTDQNGQVFYGVRVMYGTNRQLVPNVGFGGDIDDFVSYGAEMVLIPEARKRGEFRDRDSLLRRLLKVFKVNSGGGFIKIDSSRAEMFEEDEFFKDISKASDVDYGDILVFVHGFNVGFYEAIKRAGQVAYDLDLNVQPVLFSWPSQGRVSRYFTDFSRSGESKEVFQKFIEKVAASANGRRIHILAHSMGSQVVIPALAKLYEENPKIFDRQFGNVILAAPDFDRRYFKQQFAGVFERFGRSTIYMTSDDMALELSSYTYLNDKERLGYSGKSGYASNRIDAIDITQAVSINDVLGHSRYGNSSSVLNDMHYMLRSAWRASDRFGMRRNSNPPYWVFKP